MKEVNTGRWYKVHVDLHFGSTRRLGVFVAGVALVLLVLGILGLGLGRVVVVHQLVPYRLQEAFVLFAIARLGAGRRTTNTSVTSS